MRDLLSLPSPKTKDFLVEAADWVEANCFFKADRNLSREDLALALARSHSVKDTDARSLADDVFLELEDRAVSCGIGESIINTYPFLLNDDNTVLSLRKEYKSKSNFGAIYIFLLMVTRADMDSKHRILKGIDPTHVFENLCGDVLRNFWHGNDGFSGSLVFGTARKKSNEKKSFSSNIQFLTQQIGEGAGFKMGAQLPGAGDGSLDIVAWRKFSDKREGGLVGFAQCKTGVTWKEHLTKLRPNTFTHRFLIKPLVIEPIRIYMVPARVERVQWDTHSRDGGLLFDRCRITQYSSAIQTDILKKCKIWSSAAIVSQQKGRFSL